MITYGAINKKGDGMPTLRRPGSLEGDGKTEQYGAATSDVRIDGGSYLVRRVLAGVDCEIVVVESGVIKRPKQLSQTRDVD